MKQKTLVLRLSSLGDVILSSASLEVETFTSGVDWVVAKEYADVLRGHPRINRLWEFDRRNMRGITEWLRFGRDLYRQNYDQVIDLHGSIRTRLFRLMFLFWGVTSVHRTSWRIASKQRFRSWGFIVFKRLWPRFWLSRLQVEVFAKTAGGTGQERPSLKHLVGDAKENLGLEGKRYLCFMPGSNWPGKTWSAAKYFRILQETDVIPVVMGTPRDPESVELVRLLSEAGLPHVSGIGKWDLVQVAQILAGSDGYIGSDTGLAHLAEAVGVRILVIYGPTAPGLGFEPWRETSRTVGSDLWCRPCGKIGNRCYRVTKRFECLRGLEPKSCLSVFYEFFGRHRA